MAKQTINIGSGELAGDGESIRSAFGKINDNFDEIYNGGGGGGGTELVNGTYTVTLNTIGSLELSTGTYIQFSDGSIQNTAFILPTATTATLGGVKVDGTTITIQDGVISSPGVLPDRLINGLTELILGADGILTLPAGGNIVDSTGTSILIESKSISNLLDVDAPTPVDNDYLRYVGGDWVNSPFSIEHDLSPTLGGNLNVEGRIITSTTGSYVTLRSNSGTGILLQGPVTIGSGSNNIDGSLYIIRNSYDINSVVFAQHHESQDASNINFYRTRGTSLNPTSLQAGDDVVDINFQGHDGSRVLNLAAITVSVEGTGAPGIMPSQLSFSLRETIATVKRAELSSSGTWKIDNLSHLSTTTSSISVSSGLVPSTDLTYDLGSTSSQWRSLYVGTSTIYLGGTALSVTPIGEISVNGNPVTGSGSPYKLVNGVHEIVLDTNGTLTLPEPTNINFDAPSIRFGGDTSVATNNYGFGVPGPAAGVVYNATTLNLASMKLLVTIEGQEDGGDGLNHTQVCEMLVVRRTGLTVNTVDSVVYGVLHTSLAPLATLTAQLDVNGRVEILAQPTNTTAIYVKVYATEVVRGD